MSDVLKLDATGNALGGVDVANAKVLAIGAISHADGNLLKIAQYRWDDDTGAWVPYEATDSLEVFLADTHANFGFANVDADDADYLYVGYLDKAGNWIIMQFDEDTGIALYASDFTTPDYATAWANRATQAYRPFNVEF